MLHLPLPIASNPFSPPHNRDHDVRFSFLVLFDLERSLIFRSLPQCDRLDFVPRPRHRNSVSLTASHMSFNRTDSSPSPQSYREPSSRRSNHRRILSIGCCSSRWVRHRSPQLAGSCCQGPLHYNDVCIRLSGEFVSVFCLYIFRRFSSIREELELTRPSSFQIAMSVRATNVYEERSLGLFDDQEEGSDEEDAEEAIKAGEGKVAGWTRYLTFHARSVSLLTLFIRQHHLTFSVSLADANSLSTSGGSVSRRLLSPLRARR